ncbi:glycosyltransferase [Polaribacter sp. MSW13]|uniref:Glycosyltransferase n=1 Tax=Polaribacter marinus TaxID=2916838 RepID=A0A9X1VK99_9FLAO|nr:glycosyltransferase [Polaribacter marinus]MCI2227540.1 glycosyltransferase [Polaribacter marinus]
MGKKNEICCIFNIASHYREPIYKLMDEELKCDFYFGDKVSTLIKLMDTSTLKGYKKTVKNKKIIFKKFVWQVGVVKLAFKKYKFFILTGDTNILSNWLISLFCLILNKKVYLWMHGLVRELSWKEKLLTYPQYFMANKFLLYGETAKRNMIKKGFNEKKMICIYNSLDYVKQLKIRSDLKLSNVYKDYFKNDYPVLIYIGRIQLLKKIDMIIDAMGILKSVGHYCNLIIIGDDNENVFIDKIIKKNNLQNYVWLYGSCYKEELIGNLIFNADVCVSPGNVGLTAMHSLVYGTPVITHDNISYQMPEFEAIEPGLTGDFFEEDNLEDLCQKIKVWTSIKEQKRQGVRESCYTVIEKKYNPMVQIKILKNLFNI